jgi:hypothetical protein
MRQVIKFFLRFYPAEHRAVFASEMLCTFDQRVIDSRKRGLGAFVGFAISECMGLFRGLLLEWIAKWTAQGQYLASSHLLQEEDEPPRTIVDAQARLRQVMGCMEHAIAHHDFPAARRYCDLERATRMQLQQLMSSPG